VRGLDLAPAGPSVEDLLDYAVIVAPHEDVLVEILLILELLLV
jgi:hypothetical protein